MIEQTSEKHGVEVEIEEFVLDGFERRDRYRIAEAIKRELGRLFAENGVPSALLGGRQEARIDAGSIPVDATTTPEAAGTAVARAIFQGLS